MARDKVDELGSWETHSSFFPRGGGTVYPTRTSTKRLSCCPIYPHTTMPRRTSRIVHHPTHREYRLRHPSVDTNLSQHQPPTHLFPPLPSLARPILLQRIPKQRTPISHLLELLIGVLPPNLLLTHRIRLGISPPVHPFQGECGNHAGRGKGERGAEAGGVFGGFGLEEDELL